MSKPTDNRPTFALTLEALPDPDGVPPYQRLKALLKTALRSHHLKNVRCVELPPADTKSCPPESCPR